MHMMLWLFLTANQFNAFIIKNIFHLLAAIIGLQINQTK